MYFCDKKFSESNSPHQIFFSKNQLFPSYDKVAGVRPNLFQDKFEMISEFIYKLLQLIFQEIHLTYGEWTMRDRIIYYKCITMTNVAILVLPMKFFSITFNCSIKLE